MPKLAIYQSLWAMELRRPDGVQRSVEEAFELTADAGFAGMAVDLGVTDVQSAYATLPLFERHGLGAMINA